MAHVGGECCAFVMNDLITRSVLFTSNEAEVGGRSLLVINVFFSMCFNVQYMFQGTDCSGASSLQLVRQ